jgi:putative transposase
LTEAVVALAPAGGMLAATCAALGVSRATVHRRRIRLLGALVMPPRPRPRPARALTVPQRQKVLDLLHAPRFADQAPAEIYASLLDEGVYHCSIRTMYRLLDDNGEIRERRRQLRHPAYRKPELLARGPNEVWSWDITKLKGPTKNGATSIFTSSSTSLAAASSAGVSPTPRPPRCSARCSMTPLPSTACSPAS